MTLIIIIIKETGSHFVILKDHSSAIRLNNIIKLSHPHQAAFVGPALQCHPKQNYTLLGQFISMGVEGYNSA